jgi:hypothetical protein
MIKLSQSSFILLDISREENLRLKKLKQLF